MVQEVQVDYKLLSLVLNILMALLMDDVLLCSARRRRIGLLAGGLLVDVEGVGKEGERGEDGREDRKRRNGEQRRGGREIRTWSRHV